MQYRRLGKSGLQLSALSFGAWVTFGKQVGRSLARDLLAMAHDRGVNTSTTPRPTTTAWQKR
jgi:aryl-alcohol dehydrogenase-like predicted oxidoreductase